MTPQRIRQLEHELERCTTALMEAEEERQRRYAEYTAAAAELDKA